MSGWMKRTMFDLAAKVSGDDVAACKKLSMAQRREMLQKLLFECPKMILHMETTTLTVHEQLVDENGSKLKVSNAIEAPSIKEMKANHDKYKKGLMTIGPGMYEGLGVPVRSLVSQ